MSATEHPTWGFGLPTLLQILELERRTCSIAVSSKGRSGRLCLRNGELVDAETAEQVGQAAALELLRWQETEAELWPGCDREGNGPPASVTALLIELSRADDEARRGVADVPQPSIPVAAVPLRREPTAQEEITVSKLPDLIERFKRDVPEFVATDIVSIESGLSIGGGSVDPEFDASIASASYAEVVKANARALDLLGLGGGSTEDILITCTKVYVLLRVLGGDYYHGLAVTRRGNLGLARALMKKYEPELLRALGELA